MRVPAWGLILAVGILAGWLFAQWNDATAWGQRPAAPFAGPGANVGDASSPVPLLMAHGQGAEGRQMITLVDPRTRVMSVYHLDAVTGQIHLKSVRNTRWDMLLDEFNGASPSPKEIRQLLEQH